MASAIPIEPYIYTAQEIVDRIALEVGSTLAIENLLDSNDFLTTLKQIEIILREYYEQEAAR